MNSKHHFLRLDGVKVAHSPHMVGDLGSTPSPGIRKGCCLVFIIYMRFYTIYTLLGDFNMQVNESLLSDFLTEHNLEDLIKTKTCFKSQVGTVIDPMLTNLKSCFQHTNVLEIGLSDYHLMICGLFRWYAGYFKVASRN